VHRAEHLTTFWEHQLPAALRDCPGLHSIGYIYASGMDRNMQRRRPVGRPRRKSEVSVKLDVIILDLGVWSGQLTPPPHYFVMGVGGCGCVCVCVGVGFVLCGCVVCVYFKSLRLP
jgi:hypothetical protein